MSFASMQSMANQRAINQKPRRRKPQPRPEWGADPAPRAAMGGSRGPSGPGASWDGSMGLPKIGAGSPTAGARREVVHGRRASGSSTPGGGRSGTPGAGRRGPGGRGRSLHGGGRGGGPVAKQGAAVEPEPAPMPAPPSLLEQAPMPTEEQIMSMTDEEVEEMIAKSMAVQNLLMSQLAAQEEKLTPRAPSDGDGRGGGRVGGGAAKAPSRSRDTQLDVGS